MSDSGPAGSPFDRGLPSDSSSSSSLWHDRSAQYSQSQTSLYGGHLNGSGNSSQTSLRSASTLFSSNALDERASVVPEFASQQTSTTTQRSRTRAGTLPSRLSPGLAAAGRPPSLCVSSSAFSLFDGRPSPIGSPSVPPSPANLSTVASNPSPSKLHNVMSLQQKEAYQPGSSHLEEFPLVRSNSSSSSSAAVGSVVSGPPLIPLQQQQQQQQQQTPSQSRLRSGSLNMLSGSRPSFSPFGSSIWSSAQASSSSRPTSEILQTNNDDIIERRKSQHSLHGLEPLASSSSSSLVNQPEPDPMQPFLNELAMRTDVTRLRSYTVNTLPYSVTDEEADLIYAQQQYQKQQLHQRQLAQLQQQQQHQQQQQQQYQSLPSQHLFSMVAPNRSRAATVSSGVFEPQMHSRMSLISPSTMHQEQDLHQQTQQQQSQQQDQLQQQQATHAAMERLVVDEANNSTPTRSLWVSKLPTSTSGYTLQAIFSGYGHVESVRVLTHKNCGFVNFASVESAVQAKNILNGKELFSGMGPCRVGFAKVVLTNGSHSPEADSMVSNNPDPNGDIPTINVEDHLSNALNSSPPRESAVPVAPAAKAELTIPELSDISQEIANISKLIGTQDPPSSDSRDAAIEMIDRALSFTDFKPEIGPPPDPRADRNYDAPALREVRKKIDSGTYSQEEIEDVAIDLLDDIAALSSDYVGNTVVQKLFDACSEPIKDMMLVRIAPHLAEIGVHKNGTWAAQKIIDVCNTKRQMKMIVDALRPYTAHLFLDQFGNYVIQCCLKFGSIWNDFIFETMLSQFWKIAQGRFGARAMRACLESHYVSDVQRQVLAATIAVYTVPLAMNTNGALLLTWFLDTCSLKNRHQVLAPRLVPHIVPLCTHKLASLTVLKVLNYKDANDFNTKRLIVDALFGNDDNSRTALDQILSDTVHGPTFVYKVLSTPGVLESNERQIAVTRVRQTLATKNVPSSQNYKRLLDEVGFGNGWTESQAATASNVSLVPMQVNNNNGSSPIKQRKNLRKTNSHGQGAGDSLYFDAHQLQQQQQQQQQGQLQGTPAMPMSSFNDLQPRFEQMNLSVSPGRHQYQQQSMAPGYGDYFMTSSQPQPQNGNYMQSQQNVYSNISQRDFMVGGYPPYYGGQHN